MNILMIGTGIPTKDMKAIGGAGRVVIKIAETLAKKERIVVIPWWSERPKIFSKNQMINGVEYVRRNISLRFLFLFLKYAASGYKRSPVKYSHGFNNIKYKILYLFDRAHVELVFKDHKIEIIHIHGIALNYLPYIDAAIDNKIPIVCTSHGSDSLNPDIRLDFDKTFERDLLIRLSNTEKATITAVSNGVKKLYNDNFKIPEEKINVIFNGVDSDIFGSTGGSKNELREKYALPSDKKILLQVGALSKRKNHISVLTAINDMDNELKEKLLYLVVGEGEEKEKLIKFIEENGLGDYVRFMGYIPPSEKFLDMYRLPDFFILPSTSEGLPLVFLEALASGLPIITFGDLQGVSDIFNKDCMEIVSNRDTKSMISAIDRAIVKEWNIPKIIEFGKSWNWDIVCEEYRKRYRSLLEPGRMREL